jgi:hypothetical protein
MDVMEPKLNRHLNAIDGQLHDLECMAEFAALLAEDLTGDEAKPGFLTIELGKGDRLAFCCYDILRRINAVRDSLLVEPTTGGAA